MMPDSKTVTSSFLFLKKEGRIFTLTAKGEAAIRTALGEAVPATAKLSVESTDDGLRVVAKYEEVAT